MRGESTGRETRIFCAYDGSVNAHWVARYAIHLAASTSSRALHLIHVRDGHVPHGLLAQKLEHVLGDCRRAGIEATTDELQAADRGVAAALLEAVPADAGALLLCGTRARARRQRLLTGTVSESLLRTAACHVLALRVVLPGLLGAPRRVLVPVAGNPGEGRAFGAVLGLLLPALEELHLLRVVSAADTRTRIASRALLGRLRAQGRAAVTAVENELRAAVELADTHVDAYVRVAEDWVGPSLVAAGQHKCGLILAGASPHLLAGGAEEMGRVERLLERTPCDVGILRSAL